MIALNQRDSITLWLGIGKATHYECAIDSAFLARSIADAALIRQERRVSKTRKKLLDSLRLAGIEVSSQTGLRDKEDEAGLIGEIIVEFTSIQRKYECLWPKWRVGGTSKSRGIDLVAKITHGGDSGLMLVESKHLHEEVKGRDYAIASAGIRARFKDGMDEFDHDKTELNISGVLRQMGDAIVKGRTGGADVAAIERSHDFVRSKLRQSDWSEEVVACVDSLYCTKGSLAASVVQLQLPSSVGKHSMGLVLLACHSLEVMSDKI